MQIQISWLLQKPTDLDLHCLQRWDISGFLRTRVKFGLAVVHVSGITSGMPLRLIRPSLFLLLFTAGQSADPNATLSDHLLLAVLQLLKKEVSEHGRHLQQYFHLFLMYSNLGVAEVCFSVDNYQLHFGCARINRIRLETRKSQVQIPPRSATFFRGD